MRLNMQRKTGLNTKRFNLFFIDIEKLRKDLINYYGTAFTGGFPVAFFDMTRVEKASDEELLEIAKKRGIDLTRYKKQGEI